MFRYAGTKWALACKVPNGKSKISAYENIKSAVSQIDSSDAERGLVVLHARNWINHNLLWRKPGGEVICKLEEQGIHWAWASAEMPFSMLRTEADERYRAVCRDKGEELLEVFHRSAKAASAVLNFLQSATLIASPDGPLMSRVGTFVVWPTGKEDDGMVRMATELNDAMFRLPAIPNLD